MAIYFLANERARTIKIGFSDEPDKRMRQLQTASSDELDLVALIPGQKSNEERWHERWDHLKVRGEWFAFDDHLIEAIRCRVADSGLLLPGRARPRAGFVELANLEPNLWWLYRLALAQRVVALNDKHFCANGAWYGYDGHNGIKPSLLGLVGWLRPDKHPELRTMQAYDTAYHSIYEALPDCKADCACQIFLSASLGA